MDKCTVQRLSRRKVINFEDTSLPRVLTLIDLTALGIGSTIGVGFYVLAGDVARAVAGPAVTISFLIAGIASLFAGLCYAEFGGRVPKAGSAYIYTYVCIGEFIAFVIGWNLILEYVIGTASIASGFSGYIDAFFDGVISEAMRDAMPMDVSFLSEYPDFLAAGLCLLLAAVLAFGVKESSLMNNVVTIINLFVVVYVIITAATKANLDNWSLSADYLNSSCNDTGPLEDGVNNGWGVGGFAPYGFGGIMQGAATCFYGFVGFDVIASTGEEALRPERNLPISICLSLLVIFVAYFGMASTLTLAIPYCQQDASAPLIYLYEYFDMNTAKIIVSIGALFGFSASLFGAIFPMPRVIYAMASDGLLFRVLSRVNERFRSPIIATMVSGSFAAIMAMLFDLEVLVNMMSIGTLQAYTIVALCVMMLRYSLDPNASELQSLAPLKSGGRGGTINVETESFPFSSYMRQALNKDKLTKPDALSTSFVSWATLIFCLLCFLTTMFLVVLAPQLKEADPLSIVVCAVFFLLSTLVVVSISLQPQSDTKISFMVPLVPWLPALSTFINLYLMCNLPPNTWIKFAIWMAIGLALYFFYGVCFGPGPLEQRSSSKGKQSQDNSGFTRGSGDIGLEALAIPTITVLPATPLPSAANTPQATLMSEGSTPPPRRPSREVVISPLVTAELAQKKLQEENKEMDEPKGDSSLTSSSDDEAAGHDLIQAKEDLVLGAAPLVTAALVTSSADDITDEKKQEESSLQQLDSAIIGQSPRESLDSSLEVDKKSNTDYDSLKSSGQEENGVDSEKIGSEDNINKRIRPTLLPLKIIDNDGSPMESLNPSNSEPILGNKSASMEDIDTSVRGRVPTEGAVSSSVPVTPSTARRNQHPTKNLMRMSSFDSIPPSSPDSPFAKRVNDFIVIPVQEPALSTDGSETEQEGSDAKSKSSSTPSPLPSSVMSELKMKLGESGAAEEAETEETSSFEELKGEDKDGGNWGTGLPEPTTVAPTRELRPNSMPPLELDTIRERGESRVLASEEIPMFAGGEKDVAAADKSDDKPVKSAVTEALEDAVSNKSIDNTDSDSKDSDNKSTDSSDNSDKDDVKVTENVDSDSDRVGDIKPGVTETNESMEQSPESKDAQSIKNDKEESQPNKTQPPVADTSEDKLSAESFKPYFDLGPSVATSAESLVSSDILLRAGRGTQEETPPPSAPPADSVPTRSSVKDLGSRFLTSSSSSSSATQPEKPAVERPALSISQLRANFQ